MRVADDFPRVVVLKQMQLEERRAETAYLIAKHRGKAAEALHRKWALAKGRLMLAQMGK